jgi:hypothetical protein
VPAPTKGQWLSAPLAGTRCRCRKKERKQIFIEPLMMTVLSLKMLSLEHDKWHIGQHHKRFCLASY